MKHIEDIEDYAHEHHVPIMLKSGIEFLLEMVANQGYTRILELGTAIGYSSIRMAKISPLIEIDTIENDPERAKLAIQNIKDEQLSDRIHVHVMDIFDFQTDKQYDLVFVDAAKAQYYRYMKKFMPNLAEGGVFVFDNLNFHGMVDDLSMTGNRNTIMMMNKIKRFREQIQTEPGLVTQFYPEVGDGVAVVGILPKIV